MKTNELNTMHNSDISELQGKVMDLKAELFQLRFQLATGQLENPMRIKHVKKEIAQLKTILREKELGIRQD